MSVQEGLICPECMKKFQTLKFLQDHFQEIHIEQSEITSESNGFIGIIRKAKKTFEDIIVIKDNELNINNPINSNIFKNTTESDQSESDCYVSYAFYEEPNCKPQPNGTTVNKTQEFLKMRRSKLLSSAIEMSSLIIKLEKLLSFQINGNSRDRKNFEQSVVDWVSDDLVPMCPSCGGKFGLNLPISATMDQPVILSSTNNEIQIKKKSKLKTALINLMDLEIESNSLLIRKKHHCRICGCILCAQCSYMLASSEANRLVSAVNSRFELRESLLEESRGLLWDEDSQNSLDSIKSKKKSHEYYIRCCGNCKSQIEIKWNQLERSVSDSDIVDLYQKLSQKMNKISQLLPEYEKMCQSLCLGETEYSYQRTNEIRSEIVQICQQIDAIGNKFKLKIPVNGNEREANLVKSIHRNCYLFLQNNFATLKNLPNEEELKVIVQTRLMNIQKKANDERTIQKNKSPELVKYVVRKNESDSGWAPTLSNNTHNLIDKYKSTNPFECDELDSSIEENIRLNALALQMENVRQYIDMARQAKKHEEVRTLQMNMMDLEVEYETLQKKLQI